jgi:transglutaminase-like putative cysteine protease
MHLTRFPLPHEQKPPTQKSSLGFLLDGPEGIRQTLNVMKSLVRKYKAFLPLRNLAVSIVQNVGGKDWRGQAGAIQNWVQRNIRYVKDITDIETLSTPEALLQIRAGDCDDQATLTATLLESIGHPTGFVAIGFAPDEFDHVYAITRLGEAWLSVETTEPVGIGWRPDGVVSTMVVFN